MKVIVCAYCGYQNHPQLTYCSKCKQWLYDQLNPAKELDLYPPTFWDKFTTIFKGKNKKQI